MRRIGYLFGILHPELPPREVQRRIYECAGPECRAHMPHADSVSHGLRNARRLITDIPRPAPPPLQWVPVHSRLPAREEQEDEVEEEEEVSLHSQPPTVHKLDLPEEEEEEAVDVEQHTVRKCKCNSAFLEIF